MRKLLLIVLLSFSLSQEGPLDYTSVLIDSSVNGYGLYSNKTIPIDESLNGDLHMIYRKWMAWPGGSSGFLGYAGSIAGSGLMVSYPINENLPNGSLMSAARYPSILTASDGTNFAIWTENTGVIDTSGGGSYGGRLFINYDNATWFVDTPNDSMYDLNNNCLDNLPCSTIVDLWIVQPYLIETPSTYEIHTISESWGPSNNNGDVYVYIKTSIDKLTKQMTNEDPIWVPTGGNDMQFSMNENGKSALVRNGTDSGGYGLQYYIFDSPSDIMNDTLNQFELTPGLLLDLASIYFDATVNQIEAINDDEFLSHVDDDGGLHIFAHMQTYNTSSGAGGNGFYYLSNSTPDDINTWDLEFICEASEGYDFTFSFEHAGNQLINISFIHQEDGDLFLFRKNLLEPGGLGWQDKGNLTNTPEYFEWGAHAVRKSNTSKTSFIYSVVDSNTVTVEPGSDPGDYKQYLYVGLYGSGGILGGNIVINEIMQNPNAVGDSDGEWFELYNDSQDTINLSNWTIEDSGTDVFTISDGLIYPQQYFLFIVNGDQNENGGISDYDYVYDRTQFNLGNSSDEIIIKNTFGGIVDYVAYGDESNFPDPNGKSMELIFYRYNNMDGNNWIESNSELSSGDFGTPGQENSMIAPIIQIIEIIDHQESLLVNPVDWANQDASDCLIDSGLQSNPCDTAFFSIIVQNQGSGDLIFDSYQLEDVYHPLDYINRWKFHNELPIIISPGSFDTLDVSFIPWRELDDLSPWFGNRENTLYLNHNNNTDFSTQISMSVSIKLNGKAYVFELDQSANVSWENQNSNPTLVISNVDGNSASFKLVSHGTEEVEVDDITIDSDYFTINAEDGALVYGEYLEGFLEFNPSINGEFIDTVTIESNADMYYPSLFDNSNTMPLQQFIVRGTTENLVVYDLENIPKQFMVHQNYPNPFNPFTTVRYDLPEDGFINITIYDVMGTVVRTLLNSSQTAGFKSIQWNATNDENRPVSAGLYIYRIQAGDFRQTKKMVLVK